MTIKSDTIVTTNIMGRKQNCKTDHIRLINNGSLLLTSEDKYQKVDVNGTEYLARREIGNICSKISGMVLDTKPTVTLIGRIINNKVVPLKSGDPAKKDYRIQTGILEQCLVYNEFFNNISILAELRAAGFDVSDIKECRSYVQEFYHNFGEQLLEVD